MLQQILSLSTGHIAPSDAALIDAHSESIYKLKDDGYIVTTAAFEDGSGVLDQIIRAGASPAFQNVVKTARDNKAAYVWLSPDGPIDESLEFFEW